jgi:hypothetical protein
MLTINYPAFGPEVNVLTAFDNAMDVTYFNINRNPGVLLKSTPGFLFYYLLLLFT